MMKSRDYHLRKVWFYKEPFNSTRSISVYWQNIIYRKLTGAAFIDLNKALDTVEHGCILSKLK